MSTRPTKVERAWAAGIFEGEGSIRLRHGSNDLGVLACVITSTDQDMLTPFVRWWAGRLNPRGDTSAGRPAWRWYIVARDALAFLEDIHPHLRVRRVREKVELGIEFQHQKRNARHIHDPEKYRLTQLRYVAEMALLNARRS